MDLDVQLIATLNQLVVKKGATVPSHVVESLIKVKDEPRSTSFMPT